MKTRNLLRTGTTLLASLVLVAGVSFAALRSQNNIITGSRMMSASANLLISKQGDEGYATNIGGYDFFGLVPGGDAGPATAHDLYLRNDGSTSLKLQVSLNPARLRLANGASAQHTHLVIYDYSGNSQIAKYSLADLSTAYNSGAPLGLNLIMTSNTIEHLTLRMQLDDAQTDTTQQQDIDNIDLVFSGVAA